MSLENQQSVEPSPKLIPSGEGKRLQILAETGFLKLAGEETRGLFSLMVGHLPVRVLHCGDTPARTKTSTFSKDSTNSSSEVRSSPPRPLIFGPRGVFRTFKNTDNRVARMLIFAQPAGIEHFFEEMSHLVARAALIPRNRTRHPLRYDLSNLIHLRIRATVPRTIFSTEESRCTDAPS